MTNKENKVIISVQRDMTYFDSVQAEWFRCPNCKEEFIGDTLFEYCPMCGIKIEWEK